METAASSRTPRTPTYRSSQSLPSRPWERQDHDLRYSAIHRTYRHTPPGFTVAAIVERVR